MGDDKKSPEVGQLVGMTVPQMQLVISHLMTLKPLELEQVSDLTDKLEHSLKEGKGQGFPLDGEQLRLLLVTAAQVLWLQNECIGLFKHNAEQMAAMREQEGGDKTLQ